MRLRSGLVVAVTAAAVLPGCSSRGGSAAADSDVEVARAAAADFLDRYVDPDGRVVRRDQGGDTVSEGQSYGLLLAEVAERPQVTDRIAAWTENLRRPDGLLSFLAGPDDRVLDPQAASDGDLVVAWALKRVGDPAAEPLAGAVLKEEVVERGGRLLLTAGPWATGEPATLNPSYWVLPAYAALRQQDPRWAALAETAVSDLRDLMDGGRRLPADWVRADGGELSPTPAPSGDVPQAQYGLDAQRTLVWLATGCLEEARELAAATWPLLRESDRASAVALTLDGQMLNPARNPLPLVAAAAAAGAAGDLDARDRLLDEAAEQDRQTPTYYGAAWVALGRALLQTDVLDPCQEAS